MATITNYYRGQTITFKLKSDSTYVFDGNTRFKLLIYPDNIDFEKDGKANLREIDSTSTTVSTTNGYVSFSSGVATCVLPWGLTTDLKTGLYTLEILYGNSVRSVLKKNSLFAIVSAASELVDSNYHISD